MRKSKKILFAAGIFLGLACLGVLACYLQQLPSQEISRAQLTQFIKGKFITEAALTPSAFGGFYFMEGSYRLRADAKGEPFTITTRLDDAQLKSLLENPNIKIDMPGQAKSQVGNVIAMLVISGLVIMVVVHQRQMGQAKSSHKIKRAPAVRFCDVAGVEEAKAEVQEVVDFLKNPKKYRKVGGRLPKGILLIGPPGTGKTMLAKAIAGEADANFFSAHGSDFNEVYVGVGAKRIRELFQQAAKHTPAIIFIDEIDCLGKNRKFDTHGELQQTNNALLAAMDGFESTEGIIVVGATNRPEDLDEALVRPGRFDRKVLVPYPDMKGRRAILQTHALDKPIEDEQRALDVIAQTTPGMSGADLANVINEAAILCAQQNSSFITLQELEASRDKLRFGRERKSMVLTSRERELVAYHEAGHTIINLQKTLLPPLYKVSIIPRGSALGITALLPSEDQNIQSKELLLAHLVVLMGGRAAEKVFYSTTTNGANGDLNTARDIASRMVHDWGMGERLYYEPKQADAEAEINRLLENADREALAIIQAEKDNTEKLAKALLEKETLNRDEVLQVLKRSRFVAENVNATLN